MIYFYVTLAVLQLQPLTWFLTPEIVEELPEDSAVQIL